MTRATVSLTAISGQNSYPPPYFGQKHSDTDKTVAPSPRTEKREIRLVTVRHLTVFLVIEFFLSVFANVDWLRTELKSNSDYEQYSQKRTKQHPPILIIYHKPQQAFETSIITRGLPWNFCHSGLKTISKSTVINSTSNHLTSPIAVTSVIA